MAKIGLVGQSVAGGVITSSPNTRGLCEGKLIVCVGATIAPHGDGAHSHAVMVEGSSRSKIQGIPICREGDAASCGHVLTNGAIHSDVQ